MKNSMFFIDGQEKSGIDLSWSVKGQEMTFCLHINLYQHIPENTKIEPIWGVSD